MRYETLIQGKSWDAIDFKTFTRTHGSSPPSYPMTIEDLIPSRN